MIKTNLMKLVFYTFLTLLLFSSCRDEVIVDVGPSAEPALKANTALATLMQRTSLNDGSNDNIIDKANCFNLQLPVTVVVNGLEIIVDSEEDFDTIEDIFDEFDDDDDSIQINFPYSIVLSDFTVVVINDQGEHNGFMNGCNGENQSDDDIECIDFRYPIVVSIFDTVTEQTDRITINNDKGMHDFIHDLDEDDIVNITFPIVLILSDGTEISITSLDELETVIDNAKDDCDEDDDYDYNDDDCMGCTQQQVLDILTTCSDWTIDKLELNDISDLEDNYVGFTFNFSNDGTITVQEGANNYSGTWSSSGMGQNMNVVINISSLPDFNGNWNLHEIQKNISETKVDLRRSNNDRLRYESTCN